MTPTTTDPTTATAHDDLEARLLAAVTGDEVDLELVAHEIAASDHAQAYLVGLASALGSLSGDSAAAARARALLEHGLAIAAEHGESVAEAEGHASATATKQHGRD